MEMHNHDSQSYDQKTERILAFVMCVGLLFIGCTRNRVVAKVGRYEITKKEVEYRDRVIRQYYPGETRSMGLDQLERAYKYAEILARAGREVTDDVLKQEMDRIDSHTLLPESLGKIKGIFADDVSAYKRVYILPTYVERVIYFDHFMHSPTAQERSLGRARGLLDKVRNHSGDFAKIVRAEGYRPRKVILSSEKGIEWQRDESDEPKEPDAIPPPQASNGIVSGMIDAEIQKRNGASMDETAKAWMTQIVGSIASGQVFGKVIDHGENWVVVRYVRQLAKHTKAYELDAVVVPKNSFDEWVKTESSKFSLKRL